MARGSSEPESGPGKGQADLGSRAIREGDAHAAREGLAHSLVELADGIPAEDGRHAPEQVYHTAERGAEQPFLKANRQVY